LALFVSKYQVATEPGPVKDEVLIILEVDSVDESIHELRQRGVAVMREPEDEPDWGMRVAYIRDPDHNLIELNQPL
jgi:predicted enzyme related to lactoylglutathione lyase